MSGFKLLSHEILRDPTKDELYNGPKREKLPLTVQKMDQADTACTFCGVSYFVFAEVQELQQKAKCYQKHFQTILHWMRSEKLKQNAIKSEMIEFQSEYNSALSKLRLQLGKYESKIQHYSNENISLNQQICKLSAQVLASKSDLEEQKNLCLKDANCQVALIEEKIRQKDEELVRLQQQMVSALQEAAALHNFTEEELKREKSTLNTQINLMKSSVNTTKQKYDSEISRLETLVFKSEEQNRESAAFIEDLKSKLD
ncbi:hypothetical protein THRCLA_11649, partial [Thraustotheca clavata]